MDERGARPADRVRAHRGPYRGDQCPDRGASSAALKQAQKDSAEPSHAIATSQLRTGTAAAAVA
ncbi:MAG: hypothetical protein MZW92_15200 [Comamonadaceae bacterium]|nr:hypothetical protein [Comamonadaceae bacterium]